MDSALRSHPHQLLHAGCRTSPPRRVSAGCAPSGVALHLREHQGCRRCAQGFGDEDPGVQDRLPDERGPDAPRSAGRCRAISASMLSIRPQRGREQELVMVGEMPVERSGPNSFCCFTWINGVDLRYGSTADQGRTGREDSSSRLWRPARAPGTHAKRGPSTGHSAVGLRQGGKCLLTPRPHFTAPSCTLGNQVVAASDGPPFRQERRPTRVCRRNRAGRHARGEGDVAAERDPN